MIESTTLIVTFILSICIVVAPRKYFLLPFVIGACFIPASQRVIILDLDFTPLRICIMVGMLRLLARGETIRINWNRLIK
jgi:hypothetical protein